MLQGEKKLLKTGKTREAISEQEIKYFCLRKENRRKINFFSQ
jgi:hypothetical protein